MLLRKSSGCLRYVRGERVFDFPRQERHVCDGVQHEEEEGAVGHEGVLHGDAPSGLQGPRTQVQVDALRHVDHEERRRDAHAAQVRASRVEHVPDAELQREADEGRGRGREGVWRRSTHVLQRRGEQDDAVEAEQRHRDVHGGGTQSSHHLAQREASQRRHRRREVLRSLGEDQQHAVGGVLQGNLEDAGSEGVYPGEGQPTRGPEGGDESLQGAAHQERRHLQTLKTSRRRSWKAGERRRERESREALREVTIRVPSMALLERGSSVSEVSGTSEAMDRPGVVSGATVEGTSTDGAAVVSGASTNVVTTPAEKGRTPGVSVPSGEDV